MTITVNDLASAAAISLDQRCIAYVVGHSEVVRIRNAHNGVVIASFAEPRGMLSAVAVSGDANRVVCGAEDGTVRVWDTVTGERVACFPGSPWLYCVAFSQDGRRVASGGRDRFRVWDVDSGAQIMRQDGATISAVHLSPEGRRVLAGSIDGNVMACDLEGGEPVTLKGHSSWIDRVIGSPDGERLLSASHEIGSCWLLWDVARAVLIGPLPVEAEVTHASFLSDERRLVTGSRDGAVRLWNADDLEQSACFLGHERTASLQVATLQDSRFVASWGGGTLRTWEVSSGSQLTSISADIGAAVAFSPNGERIVGGLRGGDIHIWNVRTGRTEGFLGGVTKLPARYLEFSPNGSFVAAGKMCALLLWHPSYTELAFERCDGVIVDLAFSPDGRHIAVATDKGLTQIFDIERRRIVQTLAGRRNVRAIVEGHPFQAVRQEQETVIESTLTGLAAGYYPVAFDHLQTNVNANRWIGANGNYLCLFQLENADCAAIDFSSISEDMMKASRLSHPGYWWTQGGEGDGGIKWVNEGYMRHEAICPLCNVGDVYGTGMYRASLRAYFEGEPSYSIERPILRMRVKCDCARGADGFYLIPGCRQFDGLWPRGTVRLYLTAIGSPLATHPSLEDIPE